MAKFQILVLAIVFAVASVSGHGRFMKPVSRSSVWRVPEFQGQNPPPNYTDNELFCGGIHQVDDPGSNCGVCGDPLSQRTPRDNERGGTYAKGIITGRYTAGQVIDIEVELTQGHLGNMEWRLCTDVNDESQACFNRHVLQLADRPGTKFPVTGSGWQRTRVKLPDGVRCNHCVIQWNYRAGNNWG